MNRWGLRGSAALWTLAWAVTLAFVLVLAAQLMDNTMTRFRGGDSPSYLILAKALVEGYGYADINVPGSPPHTQYPPLFPLLLAPIYLVFGYNFVLMKLMVASFGVGALFLARSLFTDSVNRPYAVMIALLTGTNFYFLFFCNEVLTEVPYAFFSLLALWFAKRHAGLRTNGTAAALSLASLVALAYMTRMIGVTLLGATALYMLAGSREDGRARLRYAVLFIVLASMPFLLWSVRNSLYSEGVATYQSIIAQADYYSLDSGAAGAGPLFTRISTNVRYYFEGVARTIVTFSTVKDILPWPILPIVSLVALAGFLTELYSKRDLKDCYVLFYIALLLVWPVYGSGDARRYLVPLIPFIYHYFIVGVSLAWGGLRSLKERPSLRNTGAVIAVTAVLAVLNVAEVRRAALREAGRNGAIQLVMEGVFKRNWTLSAEAAGTAHYDGSAPCYSRYLLAAEYLKENGVGEGAVMTRKAEIVYLLTGRQTVRFPYTRDSGLMERFVREKGVGYILLEGCYEETGRYLRPFVLDRMEGFRVVLSDREGTAVLKVSKAP